MRILAVDTATEVCGVAIMIDGRLAVESITSQGLAHARGLMVNIRAALAQADMPLDTVDGFVASVGPGSFTGLRIGISTIKGLVAATGKPLVGISTLAVLAHQAPEEAQWVCAMIDARRSEVYWSLYYRGDCGFQRTCDEQAGRAERVLDTLKDPCLFIGNGAQRYATNILESARHPVMFADEKRNTLGPGTLARLGMQRFEQGLYEDPHRFGPVYLRKSDAQKKGDRGDE